MGEHDFLSIRENDTVIYSSDPAPPGSKESVDSVVDRLIEIGADVHYYDIQENLHVSGHGSQEDIKMLMAVVKPQFLMPIGGTIRHNKAYSGLAAQMGHSEKDVFGLKGGEVLEFKDKTAKVIDRIPVKQILVDGLGVGDVGSVVLRDRQVLATDGIAIVLLQFDSNKKELVTTPEVISRGFVFEGKAGTFLNETAKTLVNYLSKKKGLDARLVKIETADFLEKYFWKETKRRPMVLPVVVEV
jgi:ribonuclease J